MKIFISFLIFCLVATCNAELRTWTAVNGKEVKAEFVSNEKGIVKLKLKSGKVFEVHAEKLSADDNEFIIIEGDEYLSSPIDSSPKFLKYKANIALISGISWECSGPGRVRVWLGSGPVPQAKI